MTSRTSRGIASGGLIAWALALMCAYALPALAQTAPEYQESEPNDGATVQRAPGSVSATFSEPLDDSSTMSVVNECGTNVDHGVVTVNLNEMSVGLDEAHYSGRYQVNYRAVGVGGVTGTTTGSFDFSAAEGHSCKSGHDPNKHDPNKHDPNKHDPGKHDPGKHDPNKHDPNQHDPGKHDPAAHEDHEGETMHTGHSTMNGSDHGAHQTTGDRPHGNGHDEKGRGKHDGEHGRSGSPGGSVASDVAPELPADGTAVLLALALCAAMGLIGGLFLRTSAP